MVKYRIFICIQSESGKIQTKNYSVFGRFSHSDLFYEVDNATSLYCKNNGKF